LFIYSQPILEIPAQ